MVLMLRFLAILCFVGLPIAELYGLLVVGARIGALPTLLLLMLAAAAGVGVMRHHGARGLWQIREALGSGQSPAQPVLETLLAQVAGVLLILPGFIGDAVALVLLLPPLRRGLARRLAGSATNQPPDTRVIEGEFRRRDDV
jgi:UPF0716 protein FxsA